ncbi:MAG: hypothetical protein VX521_01155 [Chloroflexota bacterium]|nr:hypothetical protein [Chloroflexota bacterium]MEC9098697.1 hypothetical protein [Chloroflexota bacterium]
MNSKATGMSLTLGIIVGFIGYILWQITIGIDTKSDDITTILTNSGDGSAMIQISSILISIGLITYVAGLISTRGTTDSSLESIGIVFFVGAVGMWVFNIGAGLALAEMGEKFVAAMGGAAAGNAEAAATAGTIGTAGGYIQAINVATSTMGGLLAGIGFLSLGLAYRGTDIKGAISFLPVGLIAILQGLILIVSAIIISPLVSVEAASQVSGIAFIIILIWSVSRGMAISRS